jgi:hypothetical protein
MVASVPLKGILRNSVDNKYEFCENSILAFAANGEFSLPISHVLLRPCPKDVKQTRDAAIENKSAFT